MKARQFIEFL